jgi:hypothetical protein
MRLSDKAKIYSYAQHEATGQLYDGLPYTTHLNAVAGWASLFAFLLHPSQAEVALAGAYVHDLIEDCRVNYSDVMQALNNIEVAEVAYLLATPKGRTRAERHCDAYYREMANSEIATFIKICDRLANVEYSLAKGKDNHMLALYCDEHAHFSNFLRLAYPAFEPMWERLDAMLAEAQE